MNPRLRLLIIDDDRRMTRTLADILVMSGYQVTEAWSGEQAIELARKEIFDCVLTDIRMPGMNGVELYKELTSVQPGLPVVLMTAYANDDLIRTGMQAGIVGVLDKPLDINQLMGFFASLQKTRTIAVVDDDPAFCQTLSEVLLLRGYRVTQITDPHTDIETIASDSQIILLDMKLNHISGLDLLQEIRRLHPDLPVLLITGYRQEMAEAVQQAMTIDAFTCLYKPLVVPQLLETLAEISLAPLRKNLKAK